MKGKWSLATGLVLCCLGFAGAGKAQVPGVGGTLVVVNKGASTATIIDVASGRNLATLSTGNGPHEVAMSTDGRLAVVTNYESSAPSLTVIDVAGLTVQKVISLGRHGRPHGIAFLPGNEIVAVTTEQSGHVLLVDITDGSIQQELPTNGRVSHMLAIPSSATHIFTTDIRDGTVTEITLSEGGPTRKFEVPSAPEAIGIRPDGSEVWVGSNNTGLISVIDLATGDVETAQVGFSFPYRVMFSPNGRTAIIPDLNSGEVRFVDADSRDELGALNFPGAGPEGVTFTADGSTAFLALSDKDQVVVIDVAARRVLGRLESVGRPDGVAHSPLTLTD